MIRKNARFEAYLHQSLLATSTVIYFFFRGPKQGPALVSAKKEEMERGSGRNEVEWTGKVDIRKAEIFGSRRSMLSYILIYSRL